MCNRICEFCPRHDPKLYKNRKVYVSVETCKLIAQQLKEINFAGSVGFVGHSEPLLHPNLCECIKAVSEFGPKNIIIEVNTNGDFLTKELAEKLVASGCTNITVSMYDSDQSEYFTLLCEGLDVRLVLRHHYDKNTNYNLIMVNRNDIASENVFTQSINRPCYLPFDQIFVNWNGDYLICSQDWKKVTGKKYNVKSISIREYWINQANRYRKPLANGNRDALIPCNRCDINGTLRGKENFDFIVKHLLT